MPESVRIALTLILGCLLAACGSSQRAEAPSGDDVHPPGWLQTHGDEAREDLVGCQICHGSDFRGIGRAVSCFLCHLGGPPFFIHPPLPDDGLPWSHPVNHGVIAKRDIRACQGCHGRPGGAGSDPPFDVLLGGLEKGCESAGCHNPRTAHPSFDPVDPGKQDLLHWYGETLPYVDGSGLPQTALISHFNAGNLQGACTLCHGAGLLGGVGPGCVACHVVDPVPVPRRCISCHGEPPVVTAGALMDRVGRAQPLDPLFVEEVTVAGKHLEHLILSCEERNEEGDCRGCHINAPLGGNDPLSNINRHHLLVSARAPVAIPPGSAVPYPDADGDGLDDPFYGCLSCHALSYNPVTDEFTLNPEVRDCRLCHAPLFAPAPCPP